MKTKHLNLCIFFFMIISSISYCQNKEILKSINNEIWEPFTKAFETSDYNLFGSLHSEELVRVNGNGKRIQNKESYINGYKTRWENNKLNQTISFRFLERIVNEQSASERGIYKLTLNPGTNQEQSYYGKFHVILKIENNIWKILVDYDSTEDNSITEMSYNNAFEMNDYNKY